MAAPIAFEEESGTCTGLTHPHNGYYAGPFFQAEDVAEAASGSASGAGWQQVAA